jgi:hypothetical protein
MPFKAEEIVEGPEFDDSVTIRDIKKTVKRQSQQWGAGTLVQNQGPNRLGVLDRYRIKNAS